MGDLFLSVFEVIPTSPLTFRRVPLSHKRIGSYEFVPPTTFSGYLLRIFRISKGESLPREKTFKSEEPSLEDYHILELSNKSPSLCSLGAYPELGARFTSFRMGYQTIVKGHGLADGIDIFDPTLEELCKIVERRVHERTLPEETEKKLKDQLDASGNDKFYIRSVYRRLLLGETHIPTWLSFKRESRRQPLFWEFLITPKLTGYLVSSSKKALEGFRRITNYGYKIGKEGFAYIESIKGPYELRKKSGKFISSIIFPARSRKIELRSAPRLENLYYLDFKKKRFSRTVFALPGSTAFGEYYETETNTPYIIPTNTVEIFSGGILG